MEYEYYIVNWSGIKNQAANALSLLPTTFMIDSDIHDDMPVPAVASCTLRKLGDPRTKLPTRL